MIINEGKAVPLSPNAYLTLEEMYICKTSWRCISIVIYSDFLLLPFVYSFNDSPIGLAYF